MTLIFEILKKFILIFLIIALIVLIVVVIPIATAEHFNNTWSILFAITWWSSLFFLIVYFINCPPKSKTDKDAFLLEKEIAGKKAELDKLNKLKNLENELKIIEKGIDSYN